jgi:hypothetical protein
VLGVTEFLAAVDVSAAVPNNGDKVFGSDHLEVGTVEDVVEDDGENPGYIVVPRGLVFERDTSIPLDAIVKVADGKVYVNVPRLFVAKMPCDEPPTTAGLEQKLGPRPDQVGALYGSRSPSAGQRDG